MWLLLFDLDGTVLRMRRQAVRAALQEALSVVCQRPIPMEWLDDMAGKTDWQIFADTATLLGWSEEGIEKTFGLFARAYEQAYSRWVRPSDLQLLPGVASLLSQLSMLPTVVLGVLTGNVRAIALWKLRHGGIASFFAVGAFGSDHRERWQLVPIAWRRAQMKGLPIRPEQTVLVGDSPRDIACARHWGLPCIAVATGPSDVALLHAAGATVVLLTLEESTAFLRALYEVQAASDHCH